LCGTCFDAGFAFQKIMFSFFEICVDAIVGIKKHFSNFNARVTARQERIQTKW